MGTTKTASAASKGGDDRREKRRAANRRSARKSRYREVVMLDELQRNSKELTERNSALKESNEDLREAIAAIKSAQKSQQESKRVTETLQAKVCQTPQEAMLMLLASADHVPTHQLYSVSSSPAEMILKQKLSMIGGAMNLPHPEPVHNAFTQISPFYAAQLVHGFQGQTLSGRW